MTSPYTTTLLALRDGICEWFGGPYDPITRSYRQPQVPGLGVVKRGWSKSLDNADWYLGAPSSGAVIGSWMAVHVASGRETREAIAGAYGLKLLASTVTLHIYLRSNAEYGEDAQDAFYELLEALKERIRQDVALGSGGFERGGFQVGEAGTNGVRWAMAPANTEGEVTKGYLMITFDAVYFANG